MTELEARQRLQNASREIREVTSQVAQEWKRSSKGAHHTASMANYIAVAGDAHALLNELINALTDVYRHKQP